MKDAIHHRRFGERDLACERELESEDGCWSTDWDDVTCSTCLEVLQDQDTRPVPMPPAGPEPEKLGGRGGN